MPVGRWANQPGILAGTLYIAAVTEGRPLHVRRKRDAFNLPIISLVDTPGFLPGKDLEWRGMIRHGAELAFAYAQATVPRLCLILRKAFGGAYIVMDSRGIGNDICLAWPGAEVAVMGAFSKWSRSSTEAWNPGNGRTGSRPTKRRTSTPGRLRSGAWSTRWSTRRRAASCCAGSCASSARNGSWWWVGSTMPVLNRGSTGKMPIVMIS